MNFAVGSLVRARGREWVVLPESEEEMLVLRPLGGTNEEVTGIYLPLEKVEPAQFQLPDPALWGDYRSCRLLRAAVRFGFRSSAGPFRSFARIAVEPRPYQLVPLLMALRLDPVRLLIADDVGIGKTVEAGLIARELLDRREVERLAVLCPPHLAEQWQLELQEKFHIEAELVLSSTVAQLERQCSRDESIFDRFPYLIVSTDFIKADRRRDDFVRLCPELVIVDEAHTCAFSNDRGGRHQRYQLLSHLAADPNRHMILVTATPHSGNEEAFRSLLAFLNEEFKDLPADITGRQNERHRQRLAAHFIQRRRADIRTYLQRDTPFPERLEAEDSYQLTPEYRKLVEKIMSYARETVRDTSGGQNRQRVRWWSVLALLRSMASSPAAAAFTLRNRAQVADAETAEEADRIGTHTVLDLIDSDATESVDVGLGGDFEDEGEEGAERKVRNRLRTMAREAEALKGAKDAKLQKAIPLLKGLLKDGYHPIVFCRFIPTAEYVAQELRKSLPKDVEVVAVTGQLPPAEREERVLQLAQSPQRVLVCTDCLSEGINLQEHFSAVFHYDLSWNPTRHEQREGRVDRFGQSNPTVKVVTYYGKNTIIDDIVLDVLIRKHRKIRSSLGISVPVPLNTEQVVEALFESVLVHDGKEKDAAHQQSLPGFEDTQHEQLQKTLDDFALQWDAASEREKVSRTIFAQHSIKTEEVEKELEAVRGAIGLAEEVAGFTREALQAYGAFVKEVPRQQITEFNVQDVPMALRDAIDLYRFANGTAPLLRTSFTQTGLPDTIYLSRTHPLVEGLAAYVMDTALDSEEDPRNRPIARRCGLVRTSKVTTRTTLLLVRMRFHIHTPQRSGKEIQPLLAEDCRIFAFRGLPQDADWFDDEREIEKLLQAPSEANVSGVQIKHFLSQVTNSFMEHVAPRLEQLAYERANELREAHRRVRRSASLSVRNVTVEPQLPPDVLGMYIYLPHHQ
jgi:superfamily II DNA or RNA helicase